LVGDQGNGYNEYAASSDAREMMAGNIVMFSACRSANTDSAEAQLTVAGYLVAQPSLATASARSRR
jgi:hypothetical protein